MVLEIAIDVQDVSIEYKSIPKGIMNRKNEKRVKAISKVSMTINKGEVVALIGKNGSGKTTLLSAIGGFLRPASGTIETNGRVFTLKGSNPGLIPHISSRENVRLMSQIYGIPEHEVSIIEKEVEEFCELGEAYDRNYSSLSSGMAGRVGFGFTTSLNPEILLMDETLGVGDAIFREKATQKAMEFMEKGETILISTHSLNLAKSMCNRGIVLDEGAKVFDGPSEDAVRFYVENIVNRGR
ncbi:MAG: teichoic acid ABC transporter ATP-binding protein [Methanobacteriota archaeon]|jgi:ABC-2 type transport system ATP-binding protein|nr:MAG: teichoic acid ABC transporter ATP-binding protein [Euryarchaeota archaeon]